MTTVILRRKSRSVINTNEKKECQRSGEGTANRSVCFGIRSFVNSENIYRVTITIIEAD